MRVYVWWSKRRRCEIAHGLDDNVLLRRTPMNTVHICRAESNSVTICIWWCFEDANIFKNIKWISSSRRLYVHWLYSRKLLTKTYDILLRCVIPIIMHAHIDRLLTFQILERWWENRINKRLKVQCFALDKAVHISWMRIHTGRVGYVKHFRSQWSLCKWTLCACFSSALTPLSLKGKNRHILPIV